MPRRLRTAAAVAALAATGLGLAPSVAGAAPAPAPDLSAAAIDPGLLHHIPKLPPKFKWPVNHAPTYNDYAVCAGSWIYADFTDPDGGDATLDVTLTSYMPNGSVQVREMGVSDGYHGVFFFLDRAAAGVMGASVSTIRATDVWGATSETVVIDAACNVVKVA